MKRFSEPHDLRAVCVACNLTLEVLAERTGIPEDELLRFAAGTHPLCARDRYAILNELTEWSTPVPHSQDEVTKRRALAVIRFLKAEVIDEERDEEREEEEDTTE